MIITILQALFFITFIGYALIKLKKIPSSISESWYLLGDNNRILFTLFCWSIGFLMFFQTNGSSPLFFISGAALFFVGAAAAFKQKMTRDVHVVSAIVLIASALAGILVEREFLAPSIAFGIIGGGLYILKPNNKTFWIEIVAFASIIFGLLL